MNKLLTYLRESREEMRKVVWPSRQEAVKHTGLVIAISLGVAAFLGLIDYLLTFALRSLIQ